MGSLLDELDEGAEGALGVHERDGRATRARTGLLVDRRGAGVDDGEENTDTLMVIRVPNDGSSATAVSIPRDTYIHDPEFGNMKINGVFSAHKSAKKEELVYRPGDSEPLRLSRHSFALRLLQYVRDEAHRFAITAHRSQRGKIGLASRLDAVVGVGPARRKELINRFGSIEGILAASVEEISQIKGISAEMAQAIKAQLE